MAAVFTALFILAGHPMVMAYNIESMPWRNIQLKHAAEGFGYRVIQHSDSSLLVSAPLEQHHSNGLDRRGRVYQCQVSDSSCSPLQINVPPDGVNMSLGLSMSKTGTSTKTVVCGPTIPKQCDGITLYGGMCFSIGPSLQQQGPVPASLEDCKKTDIAFLLDGSGSVSYYQFIAMKTFVKNLISRLLTPNTLFAFVQYSTYTSIEVNFNHFDRTRWGNQVDNIIQRGGWTHTASAIETVVNNVFDSSAGARPNANRILIVITDGQSQDSSHYPRVTALADGNKIIRYAIGVGNAFNSHSAQNELRSIASSPASEYMFKVDSFEALNKISNTLENSIIAIEGSQTTGDATTMEFAQNGFSAALVSNPHERFLVSVVGANEWRGGYQDIPLSSRNPSFRRVDQISPDSYLGYSMAVVNYLGQRYIVMGAPRYNHKGLVMVFRLENQLLQKLAQSQIGAYFGAEVCVVDLDGDSNTDLILASAPMHTEGEREGKVFVYRISYHQFYNFYYPSVQDTGVSLLGMEGQRGRFGLSLASLADLNGDGIRDVAVGAPLEDNGQGSVYIFNGGIGGINPTYSQRIAGSLVRSGLRFFGLTVAESALDQSGDGLPDIAVGSKGAVLLLRSSPIVSVHTRITFSPTKIPVSIYDCSNSQQINASVCFTMTKITKGTFTDLQAELNYTLTLDYLRQIYRANFTDKERERDHETTMMLGEKCFMYTFYVQCSPEDVVNPVDVQVAFSFQGLPIPSADQLTPKLSSSSPITKDGKLNFEIDCGQDSVCVDNIHLNFNFSGSLVEVGIAQQMSVMVSVENRGENSYGTHVFLSYPLGLSYRTFIKSQGRVQCTSLDSTDGVTLGKTDCSINRPILRAGDKAMFVVVYGIDGSSDFDKTLTIDAQASSGNNVHSNDSEPIQSKDIAVKYSIYALIRRFENTTNYINFTAGNNSMGKEVRQDLEVTNSIRGLNLTVVIHVPVRLQDKDIWTDVDSLNITGCTREGELEPNITNFKETLLKNKEPIVDCSVAVCLEFRCTSFMMRGDSKSYTVSGNVSSGWIEQTGLISAMFHLVSSATLKYDDRKYIFYSSDSSRLTPVTKIETLVEVYEGPDLTKVIIGGAFGGLFLLVIITGVLIKVGFFKSRYERLLSEAEAASQKKE
ncbi:integrin alpha-X-like [Alosa pseudoharengus]|uniref:integrin alpha-X-like n=1 Tax=Alosa pseudoharengus TaxID=34774 RepID=UPI003F88D9B6